MPLGLLWALIGMLSLAAGPFKAAQLAILPQILEGDRYTAGLAFRQMSSQFAQVGGFAAGGFLVAGLTAQGALLFNGATFLVSAVLVTVGVRARPAARHDHESSTRVNTGAAFVRPGLMPVFILVSLTGLWVIPEGLAAPYADALGAATFAVGILMAADQRAVCWARGWRERGFGRCPRCDRSCCRLSAPGYRWWSVRRVQA
jgi:hypothetical protein